MRYTKYYDSKGNTVRVVDQEGREYTPAEFDAIMPNKEPGGLVAAPSCWPLESEALAVHPNQVQKANDRAKRHGIGVQYKPDGTAILADRRARKQMIALEGFFDNHGGYGD